MAQNNWSFINTFAQWHCTELKVLGGIEMILALTLIFPTVYAMVLGEDASVFLIPIPIFFSLGLLQFLLFAPSPNFRTVNGLILVALAWAVMFVFGSIPFILGGMDFIDGLFESVNGFTTTGSSVISDVYLWDESLLIWRSMSQWIGGIAIVIIFIYILPMFGMGRTFFSNELEGSGSSQFSMKLRNAARSFIFVYVLLTIVNFLLLLVCQASFRDALCLSLTTISTGGLIITNNSLVDMNIYIQLVTMVFMFIGGVNFYLHFKAIYGRNPKAYTDNKELRHLALWFLVIAIIIYLIHDYPLISAGQLTVEMAISDFKDSLFNVISLGTTTGVYVSDFAQYSDIILFLLVIVMMVGASAGSTSGGIKFSRVRIIIRFFSNTLKNVLHPNAVYTVKMDGENIDDGRVLSAVSITVLYLLTTFVAMIILLSQGLAWSDSMSLAVGCVTNTGVGFGEFSLNGFEVLSDPIKIFLMIIMWMGRLEITLALVFFTPTFWHDVLFAYRSSRKRRHVRD